MRSPTAALGLGLVALGAAVPVALSPRTGSVGLGLLVALLGVAAWAVGLTLGGPRYALVASVGTVVLLNAARLPGHTPDAYIWAEPLFRAGQTTSFTVPPSEKGDGRVLSMLVDAQFVGQRPSFVLETDITGETTRWACEYVHGQQWLELPLRSAPPRNTPLPVAVRLSGEPRFEDNYLSLYGRDATYGHMATLDPPTGSVVRTPCQPA